MIYALCIYIALVNLLDFILFGVDKAKAKMKSRRIPEAVLIWLAILGGVLGALIGMNLFHHKTQHKKFWIGLPCILFIQILIVLTIILYK